MTAPSLDFAALQDAIGEAPRSGVLPDERPETRGEVLHREGRERQKASLRRRLDVRGPKSSARTIYFELVAHLYLPGVSPAMHAQLLRYVVVAFARGNNDLSNAFVGDAYLITRLQLGQRSKNDKHRKRAARVALRRIQRAGMNAGLFVLHDAGHQAALPAGAVDAEPWRGPTDWGNRHVQARRKA